MNQRTSPMTIQYITHLSHWSRQHGLKTTFKSKKGKYKPSLKQDLRHRFVRAEAGTFNRLSALENELQQKEAAVKSTSGKVSLLEEELAQVKSELRAANKTNNRLSKTNEELQVRVDASIAEGTDPLEVKKLKEELTETNKALSHASKVYDGLLHQHEDLKAENERLKASRASKKAEARMNDVAVEELEKLKEDQARTLSQLEEARKSQTQIRVDLTKKLQDMEGAHQANRAAQLAALLEDEKRTIENLTVQVNELLTVYYEAKPDPSVQHLRDAQEESGRHAREKLKKQLFFERKRVDNLGRQLKAAEDQVARKQAELANKEREVELQPLCPVCWLRQCDTTFEVPEPKGHICGHLICLHCASGLSVCHFCRKKIVKRVKLYTGQSPSSSA